MCYLLWVITGCTTIDVSTLSMAVVPSIIIINIKCIVCLL